MPTVNTKIVRFIEYWSYNELPDYQDIAVAGRIIDNPYLPGTLLMAQAAKLLYRAQLAVLGTMLFVAFAASLAGLIVPAWILTCGIFSFIVMVYANKRYINYRDEVYIALNQANIKMERITTLRVLRDREEI